MRTSVGSSKVRVERSIPRVCTCVLLSIETAFCKVRCSTCSVDGRTVSVKLITSLPVSIERLKLTISGGVVSGVYCSELMGSPIVVQFRSSRVRLFWSRIVLSVYDRNVVKGVAAISRPLSRFKSCSVIQNDTDVS